MGCSCIGPDFLILDGTQMTDPIFDYERLDVYRLAIDVDSIDPTN
jgi:hypothetical protein